MVTAEQAGRAVALVIYLSFFSFILPSFLYVFPITAPIVSSITTLANWYFGQSLIFCGLIFIADMLISSIEINTSGTGFTKGYTFGSILFAGGAITSIVLGILVFFNQYSFLNNLGLNTVIIGALGIGMGSGLYHVRSVVFKRGEKKGVISVLNG